MTDKERSELRAIIHRHIDEINNTIESHRESSKPVEPDNAIGRLTRMEAIGAKSISEANLTNARNRLTRLENTLKRIDSDSYGICSMCEEDIPFKRLQLLPETLLCVGCMKD